MMGVAELLDMPPVEITGILAETRLRCLPGKGKGM